MQFVQIVFFFVYYINDNEKVVCIDEKSHCCKEKEYSIKLRKNTMAKFNTIKEMISWFEVNYPRSEYRYEKSCIAIIGDDIYLPMGRYMTISGQIQDNLIKTNVTDRYLVSTSRGYWKNRNGKNVSFPSREEANVFVETIVKKFYKGRICVEYESKSVFEIDEKSKDFLAAMEISRLQKCWIDEGNTLKDLTDYDYNNYLLSHHSSEFYGCFARLIGQYASRCVRIFECCTFDGLQREGVAEKPSWMVRKEAVKAAEEAARKAEIEAYRREHPNEENSSPDDGRFDRGPRNVWEYESSLGFFGDSGWYDE